MLLKEGMIVDGQYEIRAHIGSGGLGSVYSAFEYDLSRLVALKVLNSNSSREEEVSARFFREAKIMAQLNHRNIVRFYRFGTWQNLGYIAMELVTGVNLKQLIVDKGRLDLPRSLNICRQICLGLKVLHENGVVHRDLKPNNILLSNSSDGELVQITDFGLSGFIENAQRDQKLTNTGDMIGSVHYMAPEQCRGEKTDARTDTYALGCIFYECLLGRPPFVAENPVAILTMHAKERVSELENLPAEVAAVIEKSLQKDKEKRYQNADCFLADIDRLISDKPPEIAFSRPARSKFPNWLPLCLLLLLSIGSLALFDEILLAPALFLASFSKNKAQTSMNIAKMFSGLGKKNTAQKLLSRVKTNLYSNNKTAELVEVLVLQSESAFEIGQQSKAIEYAEQAFLLVERLGVEEKWKGKSQDLLCKVLPQIELSNSYKTFQRLRSLKELHLLSAITSLNFRRACAYLATKLERDKALKIDAQVLLAERELKCGHTDEAIRNLRQCLNLWAIEKGKLKGLMAAYLTARMARLAYWLDLDLEAKKLAYESLAYAGKESSEWTSLARNVLIMSFLKNCSSSQLTEFMQTLDCESLALCSASLTQQFDFASNNKLQEKTRESLRECLRQPIAESKKIVLLPLIGSRQSCNLLIEELLAHSSNSEKLPANERVLLSSTNPDRQAKGLLLCSSRFRTSGQPRAALAAAKAARLLSISELQSGYAFAQEAMIHFDLKDSGFKKRSQRAVEILSRYDPKSPLLESLAQMNKSR